MGKLLVPLILFTVYLLFLGACWAQSFFSDKAFMFLLFAGLTYFPIYIIHKIKFLALREEQDESGVLARTEDTSIK